MKGRLQDAGFWAAEAWDWAVRSRRRAMLCAALALAVPLPAYALTAAGEEPPAPAALTVSASLDSCGLAGPRIVCLVDVSFNEVPEATRYTASVTRPDGSVIDYGAVEAGGTGLHVPYVGAGTYGVRVSAYGQPEDEGDKPVLLDSDSASAKPADDAAAGRADASEVADPGARDSKKAAASAASGGGQDGGSSPDAAAAPAAPVTEAAQPGPEPCIEVEPPAVSPTVEEPVADDGIERGRGDDEDVTEEALEAEAEDSTEESPAPAVSVTPEPSGCAGK